MHAGPARIEASLMSTFARHGAGGANTSLVKGAPVLDDPDAIPAYDHLPDFAAEYRNQRSTVHAATLFETEYEISPSHDINGVGLLYFAAYPIIFDLCLERYEGKGFLMSHSSTAKDLYYFANADPSETMIFRVHERRSSEDTLEHVCSLSRKSDNVRMAQVKSVKTRVTANPWRGPCLPSHSAHQAAVRADRSQTLPR